MPAEPCRFAASVSIRWIDMTLQVRIAITQIQKLEMFMIGESSSRVLRVFKTSFEPPTMSIVMQQTIFNSMIRMPVWVSPISEFGKICFQCA